MTALNLAIGRKPGADTEEEGDDDDDVDFHANEADASTGDAEERAQPTRLAKAAKIAAVASGITDK